MIRLEGIDKGMDADVLIFASKHVSKAGLDAFTVHVPGNWGKAEFGGRERTLCTAPSGLMKSAFTQLQSNSMGMEVIQEATHHGPSIGKPCMFIEIGSNEKMYKNDEAGKIVAAAIMSAVKECGGVNRGSGGNSSNGSNGSGNSNSNSGANSSRIKSAVGIGGQHHCPNFRKVMLNTDIAVGHVCPKYALESLDEEMLRQAMEKTLPKASVVVLDWKGLGGFKENVKGLVAAAGIECLRTDDFLKIRQ
ncbi:D-aminoacyl-tRNA deacylase [Candidatus Woesearchaeota archaeon]|nr:D-aminoacyl-tRNA deacylase [Candidatus Woesearchaeota archaeon]